MSEPMDFLTPTKSQVADWARLGLYCFAALIGLIVMSVSCGAKVESTLYMPDQRDILARHLNAPIALLEREIYHEGEDIRLSLAVPVRTSVDTLRRILANWSPKSERLRALLRIYRDERELTDSLAVTGSDIGLTYEVGMITPGERLIWHVNKYYHLGPGAYWGVLDVGVVSDRFAFRINPMPDSLSRLWELHVNLGALPHGERGKMVRYTGNDLWERFREYARILVSLPIGTPLRTEGLRYGAIWPRLINSDNREADSLLFRQVIGEYIRDPNMDSTVVPFALARFCDQWGDDECALHLAEAWGNDVISGLVRAWYDDRVEKRKQIEQRRGNPK